MKLPIEAKGIPSLDEKGLLSIRYQSFKQSNNATNEFILDENSITTHLVTDEAIEDIPTAWLKLYLLSLRYFKPNELNLDNIFSVLPNLAWTNKGPIRPEKLKGPLSDKSLHSKFLSILRIFSKIFIFLQISSLSKEGNL